MDLNEYYINAILANRDHKITEVTNIKEIGFYEYNAEVVKDICTKLATGSIEHIGNYPTPKDLTGQDLTIISFQIQDNYSYYALFYNSGEMWQDPELCFIAKAYYYNIIEKQKLLEEFRKLKSIDQKLAFWEDKLGVTYLDFLEDYHYYEQLREFEITDTNTKEIWKQLNEWILENYTKYKKAIPIFLKLEDLKNEFLETLSNTNDKEQCIYQEIRKIEKSFEEVTIRRSIFYREQKTEYRNQTYNASYEAYFEYYKYKREPDLSNIRPSIKVLREVNGKTLAEYKLFIESELVNYNTQKNKSSNQDTLTIQQRILLLHISGLLDGMEGDSSDKARILSPLLSFGYKSVYDSILSVNSKSVRKNKSNLEAILAFLIKNNEKSVRKKVEDELKKLYDK